MFYRLLRQPFCKTFPEKCSWRHTNWETFCEMYRMQCPNTFPKPEGFVFGVRKTIYIGLVDKKCTKIYFNIECSEFNRMLLTFDRKRYRPQGSQNLRIFNTSIF